MDLHLKAHSRTEVTIVEFKTMAGRYRLPYNKHYRDHGFVTNFKKVLEH